MPMVYWNTAGTATVKLTIPRNPEEEVMKRLQGCFVKKDVNVEYFVDEHIDPSADRKKYERSDYLFYCCVSDFREVVTRAVISYEKPSTGRGWSGPTQKTKTCTVNDPLIITFGEHFFLCCDSEDLNKSTFLAENSKEVRIDQALDNRNEFFGLSMDASYLVFISFKTQQLQNYIYKVNDRDDFNKLRETGPLLKDKKTMVGCYRKLPEDQRIEIKIFGNQENPASSAISHSEDRSQVSLSPSLPGDPSTAPSSTCPAPVPSQPGHGGGPAPDPLPSGAPERERVQYQAFPDSSRDPGTVTVKFNHLMTEAERCLEDYINKGNGTLENLKDHFRGLLPDDKLRSASDVKELLEALKEHGVITANDVHLLGVLAEVIQLRELKKIIEKFEADCLKKVEKPFAVIHLKTLVPLAVFGAINLVHILQTNPEILHTLWKLGAQVLQVYIGSVVFVLKVQSISSLKQLWKSYKDGSLKEKLKHAFNQMEELKVLSKGEEIDLEVTIDEREYREVLWKLIQLEKKGESFITTVRRQRRHSVSCERDIPEELIVDTLGDAAMKNTKGGRRHSAPAVCCERDVPEDKQEDVSQKQAQVTRPAMTKDKPESKMKRCRDPMQPLVHQSAVLRSFFSTVEELRRPCRPDQKRSPYRHTLDSFNKVKIRIGLELTRVDVRCLKSAFVGKLSYDTLNAIDPKVEGAALELLDCLQQSGCFSPNNLNLMKEALTTANRPVLVQILDEYEKIVTEATDLPSSLMAELPGPSSYLLQLLITGRKCSIGSSRINVLRESLCDKLGVKISDVAFAQLKEANQDSYTFMTLQFPRIDDKVDQLILAAVNKAEWLVNLGVLQLKIGDKAPISIDENEVEIKQVPRKETKILDVKPAFLHHHDNALDLILVVEFSFSVTPHILKQMLKHCQSAIHALSQGFDMRLAIVTYGNHFEHQPTEPIAFCQQEFSNNLEFYSNVKNELQCGGEKGPSGLADAFAAVRELIKEGKVRKEATKMCVCINFLAEELQTLEYYRSPRGNDAIELCGNLAGNGVTFYVFGIDVSSLKEKNFFLEGIASIGGGRYFQLENVEDLKEAINCVAKHDMSVEKQGQVTSKIVKEDINSSHGAIRFNGLPKAIQQNLNLNGHTVDTLKENGKSLKQVSKLAQKISLADDLDEAIKNVGPIRPMQDSTSRSANKGQRTQGYVLGKELGLLSGKPAVGKMKTNEQQKCSLSLMERQPVDLECAVRIMEKQLHRLAYFEIPEPEDEEMMSIDE